MVILDYSKISPPFSREAIKLFSPYKTHFYFVYDSLEKDLLNPPFRLIKEYEFYIKGLLNNLYGNIPFFTFWFSEIYQYDNKNSIMQMLGLSHSYIALFVRIRDNIIDEDLSSHSLVLSNIFFNKFLQIQQNIFNNDSFFWRVLVDNLKEFFEAEIWEVTTEDHFGTSWQIFLERSSAKFCHTWSLPLIASAILGNQHSHIKTIIEIMMNYVIATRILDDLEDLQDDIDNKVTYGLSTIISFISINKKIIGEKKLTKEEIYSFLFFSSALESIYDEAIQRMKLVFNLLDKLDCIYFKEFIKEIIHVINRKRQEIIDIRNKRRQEFRYNLLQNMNAL